MEKRKEEPIRLVFIGTSALGAPALQNLSQDPRFRIIEVITQPDKPAGRGLCLKPPELKQTALDLGLQVFQPATLRSPELIDDLRRMELDVIATAAYGLWIPEEVFNLPPKRTLNLHPSALPRHRGAAPVVSAILEGDREAGLSVLFVEDEMDAGDILGQISLPINPDETTNSIMNRCAEAGRTFFPDIIYRWVKGGITPKVQDHKQSSWFGRMEKKYGRIDWSRPAEEIERRCRALSPWPGSYTFFKGKRLLIHRGIARPAPADLSVETAPGQVVNTEDGPAITAGEGLFYPALLQLEYQKKLPFRDFLNGQRDFIGGFPGIGENYSFAIQFAFARFPKI